MWTETSDKAPARLTGATADRFLSHRLLLAIPALLVLFYPFLIAPLTKSLQTLRNPGNSSLSVAWASTFLCLIPLYAVPLVNLAFGHALGALEDPDPRQVRARRLAHLGFAAPSLLVAIGNVAGIWSMRSIVNSVWVLLWIGACALILIGPLPAVRSFRSPSARLLRLRWAHGISAAALAAVFVLPHLSNHVSGIWSGETHIQVMSVLRTVYRSPVIEPLLVGLILFQMVSGLSMFLSWVKVRTRDVFDTLQTMSGVYVAVFLISHMTAAFWARFSGVDPNWNWLVPPGASLIPHYSLGPLLLIVHIACGVRSVMLRNGFSSSSVKKVYGGLVALGGVAMIVIMAGLLGVHLKP